MGYNFLMTKYGIMLAIMDMVSAKYDVNGEKEKVCFFFAYLLKNWQKHQKKVSKHVDPNWNELNLSFNKFKNVFFFLPH